MLRLSLPWVLLAALALTAVGLAKRAGFVLGSEAWVRPRRAAALPQDPVVLSSSLDAARLARLTGLPRAGAAPPGGPRATQPTTLHLRALGTLLGERTSLVAIEDLDRHRVHTCAEGDVVHGAMVVKIARTLITLREGDWYEPRDNPVPLLHPGNRFTYLEVSGQTGVAPSVPEVRRNEGGEHELRRDEVERQLANFGELATTVRVVPSGQGGFKLFAIRPGSLIDRLGLQNGDRLVRVNGLELSSPDAVLEAYSRLRSAAEIELEIDRGGTTTHQRYHLD